MHKWPFYNVGKTGVWKQRFRFREGRTRVEKHILLSCESPRQLIASKPFKTLVNSNIKKRGEPPHIHPSSHLCSGSERGERELKQKYSSPVNLPDMLKRVKQNNHKNNINKKRGEPPHIHNISSPVNLHNCHKALLHYTIESCQKMSLFQKWQFHQNVANVKSSKLPKW